MLATGAQRHRDLELPGRDLAGIELAMPYLISSNRRCAGLDAGPVVATGLRVAILGGGDTSADCLGSAHREGCASVVEIAHGVEPPTERSPMQTWPRWPRLRRSYAAHLEGGDRRYAYETVEFLGRDGRVTGLRDAAGAEIEVDLVLIAVGFTGVEADLGVGLTPRSTMQVDETFATTLPGVFAAGDCVRGADLIVSAIADGRECARAVDRFLTGSTTLALPRSPDPRTLQRWLNSSPLQTPSGRAASPTAPAPSRSRAAPTGPLAVSWASRTEAAERQDQPRGADRRRACRRATRWPSRTRSPAPAARRRSST